MSSKVTIIPPPKWKYVFTCPHCGDHNWHYITYDACRRSLSHAAAFKVCSYCLKEVIENDN